MKPIKFDEVNKTYAENQPEYLPLPVHAKGNEQSEVVSCWELNGEEIGIIAKTKRLWLSIWTFGKPLQPILPTVNKGDVLPDAEPEDFTTEGTEAQSGVDLIAAERKRQVEVEGWTDEHDAQHSFGQLAMAASCYASPEQYRDLLDGMPGGWPSDWDFKWWKPTPENRVRELVKAGALIAAEIDRLLARKDKKDITVRKCRECGCTDDDCSGCVAATGEPCHWVEPDLCSACEDIPVIRWKHPSTDQDLILAGRTPDECRAEAAQYFTESPELLTATLDKMKRYELAALPEFGG